MTYYFLWLRLPIAVVCRISVTGRGPFSKASARIGLGAGLPMCFDRHSISFDGWSAKYSSAEINLSV